jgi:hypothetical protein
MKKLLLSIAILVSFISCTENNSAITYKTYNSHNKEYIVEIPSYLNLTHSIGDFMAFTKEDSYIISINTTYATNIYHHHSPIFFGISDYIIPSMSELKVNFLSVSASFFHRAVTPFTIGSQSSCII